MAKTKREYILATCFLSGAAAILSFIALGTQEWVLSSAISDKPENDNEDNFVHFGLFGGIFQQVEARQVMYELTTVCAFDLNICAVLCGDNMEDNLRKLYEYSISGNNITKLIESCDQIAITEAQRQDKQLLATADANADRIFINAGVWICTILFLIISAVFGLFSACLAIWNTASSPYQEYFSIFGLYIYNTIALVSVLLSIILWGAMFSHDLLNSNLPTYQTFSGYFSTEGRSYLGYSYWINLASLVFYIISISLLYTRNYLISKEPKQSVPLEDAADPVIYLY